MASQGPELDLSSFTDILTCILGILVLIILLTGIDASQITVLVSTPKEHIGDDKSPVYFECRNQSLFHISTENIKASVDAKTQEIREKVQEDEMEFMRHAENAQLEIEGQSLSYIFALVGQYALFPVQEAIGYQFNRPLSEEKDGWFSDLLNSFDPETQFLCFFLRPDSFRTFQQARAVAWLRGFNVSVELLEARNPIRIGPGGERVYSQ